MRHFRDLCLLAGLAAVPACQETPPPSLSNEQLQGLAEARVQFEGETKFTSKRRITIEAADIELPPTSSSDEPADEREYSFDIWVDHQQFGKPLEQLLGHELQVDVLGAPARIRPVSYAESKAADAKQRGGGVVRVSVDSSDLTQSITVIAWFKDRFTAWEADREGELARMRQDLAGMERGSDRRLAHLRAMEGLVSLPNPWGEVRTVRVFNGDLHTQIFMLSQVEAEDAFGSNFAKYFYVGRAYFRNRHVDKKLVVNTTSLRARCLFYRPPNQALAKIFLAEDSQIAENALAYLEEPPPRVVSKAGRTTAGLSTDALREASHVVIFEAIVEEALTVFEPRSDRKAEADAEKAAEAQVREQFPDADLEQRAQAVAVLKNAYLFTRSEYRLAMDAVEDDDEKAALTTYLAERADKATPQLAPQDVDKYEPLRTRIYAGAARYANAEIARVSETSPIQRPVPVLVSPTRKPFAASPSIYRQGVLASSGYIWEDYYRPMPFSAVLVSLLRKTDQHPNNVVLDVIEGLGVVAAALVGVESISSTFSDTQYGVWVALTTGVFLPEARKLLLEDIEEYLTNLGSLALETVITIGPNDSRDGYVFFPRGPIFGYGVDEFSLEIPSFIVNIDNVDVVVDGSLIEKDAEFRSGVASAESQIETARNRGKSKRNERSSELAKMQEKLRTYRLSQLAKDVEARLAASDAAGATLLLDEFGAMFGPDLSGTVDGLRAKLRGQKSDKIVLLAGASGTGKLQGALELKYDTASKSYVGEYRFRLGAEVPGGATARVFLNGKAQGSGKPAFTISLTDAKKTMVVHKDSKPVDYGEVSFVASDSKAGDTVESWHTAFLVKVTVPAADGAEKARLTIRHSVVSADDGLDGSSIELPLRLTGTPAAEPPKADPPKDGGK